MNGNQLFKENLKFSFSTNFRINNDVYNYESFISIIYNIRIIYIIINNKNNIKIIIIV